MDDSSRQTSLKNSSSVFDHSTFQPLVLTEQISNILLGAILDGKIEPGTQLLELELQKQFQVSRTPIREAFRNLEKKGLVVIMPRKGTFVKKISLSDIKENFPVRANLEGLAAKLAHHNVMADGIEQMHSALQQMEAASHSNDGDSYRKSHDTFHEIFINASQNKSLIDILRTLRLHRVWFFVSYRFHKHDFQASIDIHKKIWEKFSDPDTSPDDLEILVRNHILKALELISEDAEMSILQVANE